MSSYGMSTLAVKASRRNFIPSDSYLQDTFEAHDRYFNDAAVRVYVVTTDQDHFLPATQRALRDVGEYQSGTTTTILLVLLVVGVPPGPAVSLCFILFVYLPRS